MNNVFNVTIEHRFGYSIYQSECMQYLSCVIKINATINLLAASINLLYNSKVITGIGSMRKYCFRVPEMMLMSSYTDKLTVSPSRIRRTTFIDKVMCSFSDLQKLLSFVDWGTVIIVAKQCHE